MAILTKTGRAAIAESIKAQPLHIAWGPGDGAWTSPPPEAAEATGVINEIGRRKVNSAEFVVPDSSGTIEVSGVGNFSVSTEPTHQLFVVTSYDFSDGDLATIRQLGLFVGTVTDPALPAGQRYFTPDQIEDPGTLLQLENRAPILRSTGTRERFEILITF